MSKNYFSAERCQFFIGALKDTYITSGTWPDDAQEIDSSVETEYSSTPPEGMVLGADSSGLPAWVDKPAPTHEELVEQVEAKRQSLLDEANIITTDWRTELALGIINDDDKAKLTEWMKYIKAVKAVDTSTAPDVIWPEKPAD
ncbi:tail fiber assembly protein [Citrobacter freundii]|uniref:tail fiber assembly protein n=1 Tax=Citrobacter freundii TaxID=546 RepID=UPI000D035E39|nr:tail fiber assembly protein [Citrobacter freundii]EKF7118222.1 tail fiber assembly protein [Escherichia coli]MBJ8785211.1 tail fiber assembly protein [Citrobacter freundii]MDT1282406.1 tail fiber assembly protein [Escherichia coli]QAT69759.1 tail fiber assembly protein [Citrobacter freundii]